jgi:hypothetical protein
MSESFPTPYSPNFPDSVNVGDIVRALVICDANHFEIADAIGLNVDQLRTDYRYELRAREELLDDAVFCARNLVKKLRKNIEEGTHESMPRHVFNESAKMVIETLKSKGGWTISPETKTLNINMNDPATVKLLLELGVIVG